MMLFSRIHRAGHYARTRGLTVRVYSTSELKKIRNIGVLAHIDAGKTTTTELMLHYAGVTRSAGDVDDGDTVTDFLQQERERGITIQSAAVKFDWNKHHLNLVDTPGHVDFTIEVERSLRVMDGGVLVLDGVAGVQPQTLTIWRQANSYAVPCIFYVNKLDREGADHEHVLSTMRDKLGVRPVLLQLPLGQSQELNGVVDLVDMQVHHWNYSSAKARDSQAYEKSSLSDFKSVLEDADLMSEVNDQRLKIIEQLADHDELIADKYLEDEHVSADEMRDSIRRLTRSRQIAPVLLGSSLRGIGVQPLLDAVTAYLPSPADEEVVVGQKCIASKGGKEGIRIQVSEEEVTRRACPDEDLCALAFKVVYDRRRGCLTYFRVYSGTMKQGSPLLNTTQGSKERPLKLLQMFAGSSTEVPEIETGNIGVAIGLKNTITGDTLVQVNDPSPIRLRSVAVPPPVFTCAIEISSSADQSDFEETLRYMQKEDPSFHVTFNEETGQTLISGMGELHLDIVRDRLVREHGFDATCGAVQVAYRETIAEPVVSTYESTKVVGGKEYPLNIKLEVDPSQSPEFVVSPQTNGPLDGDTMTALKEGYQDGLGRGPLAGFPLHDVSVKVLDLDAGPGCPPAIYRAGISQAILSAVSQTATNLIEPVMQVEITVDPTHVGGVLSDVTSHRRGTVSDVSQGKLGSVINAEIPLAELVGYSTHLRSMTHGTGSFTMEFKQYAEMGHEQDRVLATLQGW
eukprot:GFYU01006053.1.p1 GENE.GFYU01006053.1~~GFYU01006053.1.p1  ORF type:complete len:740 (-),score=84.36 GFYU01006053.1:22-2241(-)